MSIEIDDDCLGLIQRRSKAERVELGEAINAARDAFGQPHAHGGIGLRKLRRKIYECRVGLGLRLVYEHIPGILRFVFVGDHDEVTRFLKHR